MLIFILSLIIARLRFNQAHKRLYSLAFTLLILLGKAVLEDYSLHYFVRSILVQP